MQVVDSLPVRSFVPFDAHQAGPYLDTGIMHRMGRLYLPVGLVAEAARAMGMVDASDYAEALQTIAEGRVALADADGELAELRPIRAALDGASRRFADLAADDEPVRPTARKPREKVA